MRKKKKIENKKTNLRYISNKKAKMQKSFGR